jgi:hypothetical protein
MSAFEGEAEVGFRDRQGSFGPEPDIDPQHNPSARTSFLTVAEIEYRNITSEALLRQSSFKGLSLDE